MNLKIFTNYLKKSLFPRPKTLQQIRRRDPGFCFGKREVQNVRDSGMISGRDLSGPNTNFNSFVLTYMVDEYTDKVLMLAENTFHLPDVLKEPFKRFSSFFK